MARDPVYTMSVQVQTSYVPEQSDPDSNQFVFAYTITITNSGNIPARLLRRHWIITDSNNKIREVQGDGVVGEQPHLIPGQSFRYTSGAVLETPVGAMQGSYTFVADDGVEFRAPIQVFSLSKPRILN